MQPVSEDVLKKIHKVLEEEYPWSPDASWPSYFGTVDRETGKVRAAISINVCHASVRRYTDDVIMINVHHPGFQGAYPEYTKWLAKEGPFSHGVLNKDNDAQILGKGIAIDVAAVGKGGALWLAKAMRYPIEAKWTPPLWLKLREQGLTGLEAFIGAAILDAEGKPKKQRGHCGVFAYGTPKELFDWYQEFSQPNLKNDTNNPSRPEDGSSIRSYEDRKIDCWGSVAFIEEKKSDGWGGYTVVKRPADPKDYCDKLKTIFKGDYKSVK